MTFVGALLLGLCQELTNVVVAVARRRRVPPGAPGHPRPLPRASPCCSCRRSACRPAGSSAATSRRCRRLRRSLVAGAALVAVVAVLVNARPDDLAGPRRPGARDRHHRPVARRAHRAVGPDLARRSTCSSASARSSPARSFGGDSVLGMLLGGAGGRRARRARRPARGPPARPAPRAEHVRHRAHRPRGGAGRPARLRARRARRSAGPTSSGSRPAPTPRSPCGARSCSSCSASLVGVVRRSWFGRQLTAIRDSELAAATLGLRVRWAKVAIFAFSAFIAGCAGALFGGMPAPCDGTPVRAGQQPRDPAVRLRRRHHHRDRRGGRRRAVRRCSSTRRPRSPTSPAWCSWPSAPPPSASAASPTASPAWSSSAVGGRRSAHGAARPRPAPRARRRRGAPTRGRGGAAVTAAARAPARGSRSALLVAAVVVAATPVGVGPAAEAQDAGDARRLPGHGRRLRAPRASTTPRACCPIPPPVDLGAPDALRHDRQRPGDLRPGVGADPGDLLANPDAAPRAGQRGLPGRHHPAVPVPGRGDLGHRRARRPSRTRRPGSTPGSRSATATSSAAGRRCPALDAPAVATVGVDVGAGDHHDRRRRRSRCTPAPRSATSTCSA